MKRSAFDLIRLVTDPYSNPINATQLAFNLSRKYNPHTYMNWWTNKIPGNSTYQDWFWYDIVPNDNSDPAFFDVRWMFWNEAVPKNWAPRKELSLGYGVYKQGDQGYYRYYFWEYAVPKNWAPIPNIKGWPLPR